MPSQGGDQKEPPRKKVMQEQKENSRSEGVRVMGHEAGYELTLGALGTVVARLPRNERRRAELAILPGQNRVVGLPDERALSIA